MNLRAPLRSSSRGFLVWMLLAAYLCAPFAAWAQPVAQAITVPFCSAHGASESGSPEPRRIVLYFGGHAQLAAWAVQFALPASGGHFFAALARAGFAARVRGEPLTVPPIAWRPPPRAPPAGLARL